MTPLNPRGTLQKHPAREKPQILWIVTFRSAKRASPGGGPEPDVEEPRHAGRGACLSPQSCAGEVRGGGVEADGDAARPVARLLSRCRGACRGDRRGTRDSLR